MKKIGANTNGNKITLHDLYEIKKKKEINNTNVFRYILDNCYKKIKHVAEHGGMCVYHKVPKIVIGFPLYNFDSCMLFLIKQLQVSGLYVSRLPSTNDEYLYISWKLDDISTNAKSRLLL
jgi:hypothetical protein